MEEEDKDDFMHSEKWRRYTEKWNKLSEELPTYSNEELRSILEKSIRSNNRKLVYQVAWQIVLPVLLVITGFVIMDLFAGPLWLVSLAVTAVVLFAVNQVMGYFFQDGYPADCSHG